MDINMLQWFFFWSMIVNIVIYAITALALLFMRGFVYKTFSKLLGINESESGKSLLYILAAYKLLIVFFNFVPWISILIIK